MATNKGVLLTQRSTDPFLREYFGPYVQFEFMSGSELWRISTGWTVHDGPEFTYWIDAAAPAVTRNDIAKKLREAAFRLLASIPEEHIGKYPFTRLYHDVRILNDEDSKENLLWNSEKEIPGWVFPKYKAAIALSEWPRDGQKDRDAIKLAGVSTSGSDVWEFGWPEKKSSLNAQLDTEEFVRLAGINPMTDNEVERVMTAKAQTTKKRVVRKAPLPINPHKVKKPPCPIHRVEMEFNSIEQKFICPEEGCKQVSRPKREGNDLSVIVGKGGISLRLVATEEGVTPLLISDDNVALDISGIMENIEGFIRGAELPKTADAAAAVDKDHFVDPSDRIMTLKIKTGVLGVDNFLVHYGE